MQVTTLRAGRGIVLVGLAAGPVLGTGVGAALSGNEPPGAWVFGLFFGDMFNIPLGLVTSALSTALVLTHAATRNPQGHVGDPGVPWCWHLLVPLPATAPTTWWIVDSPMLTPGFRITVTAAATVIGLAWVLWAARWVMAPLTATGFTGARPGTPPPAPS